MVVEDDEQILRLCQRVLERNGYTVVTADKPGEAILLCEKRAAGIDLLITDVVMPAMNGKELHERIKAVRPDIRVLYMSGYTANVIAQRGSAGRRGCNLSRNPFRPTTLHSVYGRRWTRNDGPVHEMRRVYEHRSTVMSIVDRVERGRPIKVVWQATYLMP